MSSPASHRLSQRRPQACKECTRRKRKCDRKIPCSRCVELNLQCATETVRLRKLSTKNAPEISFLESLKQDILLGQNYDPSIIRKIEKRLEILQIGTTSAADVVHEAQRSEHSRSNEEAQPDSIDGTLIGPSVLIDPKHNDAPILSALEYLAWGRNFSGCYPHLTCHCRHRRGLAPDITHIQGRISARYNLHLPSHDDARRLIDFHLLYLAWHHNCLHSISFRETCEKFWQTGDCPAQWLALYVSVLSTTIFCVQNSKKFCDQLGMDIAPMSARSLFNDMIDILNSENFLGSMSIYSVQAIVISTEVAHNLGFSELNAVLLGSAIRIAQCLGLHKITSDPPELVPSDQNWRERIDIELGRRVWCQMIVQDLFAIPFNGSHAILPFHCSTDLPINCDDDLIPQAPEVSTISSYGRILAQWALLMPELAESLGAVRKCESLLEKYAQVLRIDQKMREIVHQIPPTLLQEDTPGHHHIPWLGIARRSLAITAADKIIMIHRAFLSRAFQSTTYAYTRRTCVAASMTILREHQAITNADDLSIWTHTAFCITAAVILCFEISYCVNLGDCNVEVYCEAVQAARDRLIARKEDVLAARGVTLINAIALEQSDLDVQQDSHSSASTRNIINLSRVVDNFFMADKTDPTRDILDRLADTFPFELEETVEESLGGETALPAFYDFDEWFNGAFSEGQANS